MYLHYRFKMIGLILFTVLISAAVALHYIANGQVDQNVLNPIVFGAVIALLISMFSSEKIEDEFLDRIRLRSMQMALLFSFVLYVVDSLVSQSFDKSAISIFVAMGVFYHVIFYLRKREFS